MLYCFWGNWNYYFAIGIFLFAKDFLLNCGFIKSIYGFGARISEAKRRASSILESVV